MRACVRACKTGEMMLKREREREREREAKLFALDYMISVDGA